MYFTRETVYGKFHYDKIMIHFHGNIEIKKDFFNLMLLQLLKWRLSWKTMYTIHLDAFILLVHSILEILVDIDGVHVARLNWPTFDSYDLIN